MLPRILFALALYGLSLGLNSAAYARLYNAQSATLDNGLKLVVIPIHRTPAVTHMIWYRAGAADEPEGISGTAHYLEHLLFKATPETPSGAFSSFVRQKGGNDNAFTSWDMTAYHQTVPKDALADVMRMEASRMTRITPTLAEIDTERQVVIEERRQVVDSSPGSILAEKMREKLFGAHPYGRPIIGLMDEMITLKWVDALVYYRKHYNPANAVVIISGDTTLDEALPLARATYGQIPAREIPPRTRPQSPPPKEIQHVTHSTPNIQQPSWQYMLRVPSPRQDKAASLTLSVLADLLAGSTGKLYQTLTVDQKLATAINAGYGGAAWDDDSFMIYATPAQGVSMQELEDAIFQTLGDISAQGFDEAEVKKSITRLQDSAAYAMDSLSSPAFTVGYALITGQSLDDIENWPQDLEKVTADSVNEAFRDYILNNHGVIGTLMPEESAP